MKMIYKEKYDMIDKNMSDSNIGARKEKNIRNHIYVVNSIVHDVLSKKAMKLGWMMTSSLFCMRLIEKTL